MDKQMNDKWMFSEPCRDNKTESVLWSLGLVIVPPYHTYPIIFVDMTGGRSILGKGLLFKNFLGN